MRDFALLYAELDDTTSTTRRPRLLIERPESNLQFRDARRQQPDNS